MLLQTASPTGADKWLNEWLTGHWGELIFGLLLLLVVRGDKLLRLVKEGRKKEQQVQDDEVDRRIKPYKERTESAEALARLRGEERDEAQSALTECVQARAGLEVKVLEQQKQIAALASLQPEVLRITGELENLNKRLREVEDARQKGR